MVQVIDHTLYAPDLTPPGYIIFLNMKIELKEIILPTLKHFKKLLLRTSNTILKLTSLKNAVPILAGPKLEVAKDSGWKVVAAKNRETASSS